MLNQTQPTNKFLSALGRGQGFLKAGFLGFNKSGKTWTSIQLAIGVRRHFGLEGPVAMFDTEGGAEYVAPLVRRETGRDLVGYRGRSLKDLIAMGRACAEGGVSVLVVDSVTHPWREVCKSYLDGVNKRRVQKGMAPRFKLEFQDWGIVKDLWLPWTEFYSNSALHLIVNGRAGYDYDYETNEETQRNELIKTGVKMKTEGEFGFEPSLLVEMERVQDFDQGHPRIRHRAVVIGDRFGVIDGKVADDPGFEFFKPHLEMLTPGAHAPIDTESRTVEAFDEDGDRDWQREKERRKIFCEEVQGLMVERWPGQTADEKTAKLALIEKVFNTRSWTKVEGMPSDVLEQGLAEVRSILRPAKTAPAESETETEPAETKPAESETKAEAPETKPAETPRRSRRKSDPGVISPREAQLLVAVASRLGWNDANLEAALKCQGITGIHDVPVDRYEAVCDLIEAGPWTGPKPARDLIEAGPQRELVLEGVQPQ